MPTIQDYGAAIRGYFLPWAPAIEQSTIKYLWDWRVPVAVAVEMCAVSTDPRKMPSIPEAASRAEINLMRAELVGAGNL